MRTSLTAVALAVPFVTAVPAAADGCTTGTGVIWHGAPPVVLAVDVPAIRYDVQIETWDRYPDDATWTRADAAQDNEVISVRVSDAEAVSVDVPDTVEEGAFTPLWGATVKAGWDLWPSTAGPIVVAHAGDGSSPGSLTWRVTVCPYVPPTQSTDPWEPEPSTTVPVPTTTPPTTAPVPTTPPTTVGWVADVHCTIDPCVERGASVLSATDLAPPPTWASSVTVTPVPDGPRLPETGGDVALAAAGAGVLAVFVVAAGRPRRAVPGSTPHR
jgi:hypothetical protein